MILFINVEQEFVLVALMQEILTIYRLSHWQAENSALPGLHIQN